MSCKHKKRNTVISAKKVEIFCSRSEGCGELLTERTRVLSSNIFSVGRSGNDTIIQFMDVGGPGRVALYPHLPKAYHEGLMAAKSKGKYFAEVIKPMYEDTGKPWRYIED